jgi:hypothetical protein
MIEVKTLAAFGAGAVLAIGVAALCIFVQPGFNQYQASTSFPVADHCPLIPAIATSSDGVGFLMNNGRQYVIEPNSTAFLTIKYLAWKYTAQAIYGNRSVYFAPIDRWAVANLNSSQILSSTEAGISAAPVNETIVGSYIINATYEISASSSALHLSYFAPFWSTCGPEIIITVGYGFYTGPVQGIH